MKRTRSHLFARLARIASLVIFAAFGTIALMRFAPGYFTDAREMDGEYAAGARVSLQALHEQQRSFQTLTRLQFAGWLHGDLGRSRQFEVPVTELIKGRVHITLRLLAYGTGLGWATALALALPLSARRGTRGEMLIASATAILLSIPIGALAIVSMLTEIGGPIGVLLLLIAARDFKILYRVLQRAWRAPHLLQARAQGLHPFRITFVHLLPSLLPQLAAVASTSFAMALSSIVPVEVVFNVNGLGQLAWTAAMNRDLPVLLAVTLLLALSIGIVTTMAEPRRAKMTPCG